MDTKAKQDSEKLRLLEEALRSGQVDEKTREELVDSLTGRRSHQPPPMAPRPRSPNDVGFFLKFMAFVGWVSFCLGIGFAIIAANVSSSDLEIPAVVLCSAGFPLLTFPFVLRELQGSSRRHAAEPR